VEDHVIIAESKTLLQKSLYRLENIASKYGLAISTNKTKIMTFRGRDPIRSKTVISNKVTDQINTYTYLECKLSHEKEKDVAIKLSKFLQVTGIINQVLKPSKVQKQTRLRIQNSLAVPTLLHGSETWTLMKQDKARIAAAEIKFVRKTAKKIS
jgi:hypothetical protein